MQAKWNCLLLGGNLATKSISSALLLYMVGVQPPYGGSFLSQELGEAGSQRKKLPVPFSPYSLPLSHTMPLCPCGPYPSGHGLSWVEAVAREPISSFFLLWGVSLLGQLGVTSRATRLWGGIPASQASSGWCRRVLSPPATPPHPHPVARTWDQERGVWVLIKPTQLMKAAERAQGQESISA